MSTVQRGDMDPGTEACDINVKVAVRVRPLQERERRSGLNLEWKVNQNQISQNISNATPYVFDTVFDQDTDNITLHEELCVPIIQSAIKGFHGTIFAYGQSGSGKTHTMSGTKLEAGIMQQAMEGIFSCIDQCPTREFLLRLSYIEIYNEKLFDLLATEEKPLKIQEDVEKQVNVIGVEEKVVHDVTGVLAVIQQGDSKRRFAETKQNERSSRSHCILRMVIESREKGDENAVMVSHLNFVDLAGSERAGDNSGDRLREGCAINRSLLTLGQIIAKLSEGGSNQYIGYRDSKLTRILQNALGGNSKTAIVCTISPTNVEESHSTLRFASRAKNIKNKPIVNEIMSESALLKKYQLKIAMLQNKLTQLEVGSIQMEKADLEKKLKDKEELQKEHEEQITRLRSMLCVASSSSSSQDSLPKRRPRRETWCGPKLSRRSHVDLSDLQLPGRLLPLLPQLTEEPEEEPDLSKVTIRSRGRSSVALSDTMSAPSNLELEMNEEIRTLGNKLRESQGQVSYLESKLTEQTELTEFLNLEKMSLEQINQEYHQKIQSQEDEESKTMDYIQRLEKELEKVHETVSEISTANRLLSSENTQLKQKLKKARHSEEAKVKVNDDYITMLERQVEQSHAKMADMEKRLSVLPAQLPATQEREKPDVAHAATTEEVSQQEEELASRISGLASANEKLVSDLEVCRAELEAALAKNKHLEKELLEMGNQGGPGVQAELAQDLASEMQQAALEEKSSQIQRLSQELEESHVQLTAATERISQMEEELASKVLQIDEEKKLVAELKQDLAATLIFSTQTKEEEQDGLKSSDSGSVQECSLRTQVTMSAEESSQIQRLTEELEESHVQQAAATERISQLEEELASMVPRTDDEKLVSELEVRRAELEAALAQNKHLEQELLEMGNQTYPGVHAELAPDLASEMHQADLEEKSSQIQRLTQELEESHVQLTAATERISQMEEELASKILQVDEEKKLVAELKQDVAELTLTITGSMQTIEKNQDASMSPNSELKQESALGTQLATSSQIQRLTQELEESHVQLAAATERISQVEEELASKVLQIDEEKKLVAELKQDLAATLIFSTQTKEEEQDGLKSSDSDLVQECSLRTQVTTSEEKSSQMDISLKTQLTTSDDKSSQIQKLTQEMAAARERISQLEEELASMVPRTDDDKLVSELEVRRAELEAALAKNKHLEKELLEMGNQGSAGVQAELAQDLASEMQQAALEEKSTQIQRLTQELEESHVQLTAATERISQMEEELASKILQIDEEKKLVAELKQDLAATLIFSTQTKEEEQDGLKSSDSGSVQECSLRTQVTMSAEESSQIQRLTEELEESHVQQAAATERISQLEEELASKVPQTEEEEKLEVELKRELAAALSGSMKTQEEEQDGPKPSNSVPDSSLKTQLTISDDKSSQIQKLTQEMATARERISQLEEELASMVPRTDDDKLVSELEVCRAELEAALAKNKHLEQELLEMGNQGSPGVHAELAQDLASEMHQAALDEKSTQIQRLTQELEESHVQLAAATERISQMEEELASKILLIDNGEKLVTELRQDIAELTLAITGSMQTCEKDQDASMSPDSELSKESALGTQLATSDKKSSQIQRLAQELAAAREKTCLLEEELASKTLRTDDEKLVSELEVCRAELEAALTKNHHLEQELLEMGKQGSPDVHDLLTQRQQLQQQLKKLAAEKRQVQKQLSQLGERLDLLTPHCEDLAAAVETLTKEKTELQARIDELEAEQARNAQSTETETPKKDLTSSEAQTEETKEMAANKFTETNLPQDQATDQPIQNSEKLEAELSKGKAEIARLCGELEQKVAELAELQSFLEGEELEIDRLTKENETLQAETSRLRGALKTSEEKLKKSQEELKESQTCVRELEATADGRHSQHSESDTDGVGDLKDILQQKQSQVAELSRTVEEKASQQRELENALKDSLSQRDQLESTVRENQSCLEELRKELEEAQSQHVPLERVVEEGQREREDLQNRLEESIRNQEQLESRLKASQAELEAQVRESQEEQDRLETALQESQQRQRELEVGLEQSQAELAQLKNFVEEKKAAVMIKMDALKHELESKEEVLEEYAAENAQLREQLEEQEDLAESFAALQSHTSGLEGELAAAQDMLARRLEELEEAKQQLEEAHGEAESLQERCQCLEQRLAEAEDPSKHFSPDKPSHEEELTQALQQLKEVNKEAEVLRKKCQQLADELATSEKANNLMEQQLQVLEGTSRQQVANANREVDSLRKQCQELEQQLATTKSANERLLADLVAAEKLLQELTDTQEQLSQVGQQLEEANKEAEGLREQCQLLQQELGDARKANEKVTSVQSERSRQEEAEAQKKLEKVSKEAESLRDQCQQLQQELADARKANEQLSSELSSATAAQQMICKDLALDNLSNDQLKKEAAQLNMNLIKARATIRDQQKKIEKLNSRQGHMSEDMMNLNEKIQKLTEELQVKTESQTEAEARCKQLNLDLHNAEYRVKKLTWETQEKQRNNDEVVENLRKNIRFLKAEIRRVQEKDHDCTFTGKAGSPDTVGKGPVCEGMAYNSGSGVVDSFMATLLQAENKRLSRENEKLKARLEKASLSSSIQQPDLSASSHSSLEAARPSSVDSQSSGIDSLRDSAARGSTMSRESSVSAGTSSGKTILRETAMKEKESSNRTGRGSARSKEPTSAEVMLSQTSPSVSRESSTSAGTLLGKTTQRETAMKENGSHDRAARVPKFAVETPVKVKAMAEAYERKALASSSKNRSPLKDQAQGETDSPSWDTCFWQKKPAPISSTTPNFQIPKLGQRGNARARGVGLMEELSPDKDPSRCVQN